MTAILRVKRRNDAEPLDALLIACKRRKIEKDAIEEAVTVPPVTAVLKFAGTVQNQNDDVVEHLVKNFTKEELQNNFKQHPVDVRAKTREKSKQTSADNRYKVVNCFRSLNTSHVQELDDKVISVIDVEESVPKTVLSQPAVITTEFQEDNYVYDVYYTHTEDNIVIDDSVSVHPLNQDLVFEMYTGNGMDSENDDESEDSNSESNWRNDYPDSDHSEGSVGEEDMRRAMKNMKVKDDDGDDDEYDQYVLSSEEDAVSRYGLSSEDAVSRYGLSSQEDEVSRWGLSSDDEDYVYALKEADVDKYGYKYAKYKAKMKKELEEDEESNLSECSGFCISELNDEEETVD